MPIRSVRSMVDEANAAIASVTPESVSGMVDDDSVVIVDIRDVRELQREGKIPGAVHCPRGMLEFWIDPESPYHKPVFAQPDKSFVFYCASAWRSALATKTAQDMGLERVKHIEGGFSAWQRAGYPVETVERK